MKWSDKIELFIQTVEISKKTREGLLTNLHESFANLFTKSTVYFLKKTALTLHKNYNLPIKKYS